MAHIDIANRIAKCAIDHYDNNIPSNGGKPQIGREWTVYAAIVACKNSSISINNDDDDDMWVVSCATGSKCISIHSVVSSLPAPNNGNDSFCQCYKGMLLKDSHAEALCRRGLVASLWNEIENYLQQYDNNNNSSEGVTNTRHLLEISNNNTNDLAFKLKSNITLHMYISDPPCGDATIYEIRKQLQNDKGKKSEETELNFTGAKLILADPNTKNDSITSTISCSLDTGDNSKQSTITLGREDTQQLGALRLKSSRSNITNRSTSMSCSDKLVRWGVFGLQGTLLSTYIPEPICLSSVCVSKDPRSVDKGRIPDCSQLSALERALPKRIESVLHKQQKSHDNKLVPPVVSVVDIRFESSKSAADYRFDEENSNERKRKLEHTDTAPNKKKIKTKHTSPDSQTLKYIHNTSKQASACGMSINWHQTHLQGLKSGNKHNNEVATTEITIGATGLKRGKKPKRPKDVLGSASRLCRFNLLQRCLRCTDHSSSQFSSKEDITAAKTYMQYKQKCSKYASIECFQGPLAGYIRSGKEDDFQILSSIDKDSN